jgi:hypothetical protein
LIVPKTTQPVEKCPAEFIGKDELKNPRSSSWWAKTKEKGKKHEIRTEQKRVQERNFQRKTRYLCVRSPVVEAKGDHCSHGDLPATEVPDSISEWFLWRRSQRKGHCHGFGRKRTSPPSAFLEQAFEILTSGDYERLAVDPPETA